MSDHDRQQLEDALDEMADDFEKIYEVGGVFYCGLCNERLVECACFNDAIVTEEPDRA